MATMIREELFDAADAQEDQFIRRAYDVAANLLPQSPFNDTDACAGEREFTADGVWLPVRVYIGNDDIDDDGREALAWHRHEWERRIRSDDLARAAELGDVLSVAAALPDLVEHRSADLASALMHGDLPEVYRLIRWAQQRRGS